MSDHAINVDRAYELAGAVCDAFASLDDIAELDSLVAVDETSRRCYWDCCWIHVSLRMEAHIQRAIQKARERSQLDATALKPWESEALAATVPPSVVPTFPPSPPSSPPPSTALSAISPRAGRWRIWWQR